MAAGRVGGRVWLSESRDPWLRFLADSAGGSARAQCTCVWVPGPVRKPTAKPGSRDPPNPMHIQQ